jgi:hypothetical protein
MNEIGLRQYEMAEKAKNVRWKGHRTVNDGEMGQMEGMVKMKLARREIGIMSERSFVMDKMREE